MYIFHEVQRALARYIYVCLCSRQYTTMGATMLAVQYARSRLREATDLLHEARGVFTPKYLTQQSMGLFTRALMPLCMATPPRQ